MSYRGRYGADDNEGFPLIVKDCVTINAKIDFGFPPERKEERSGLRWGVEYLLVESSDETNQGTYTELRKWQKHLVIL